MLFIRLIVTAVVSVSSSSQGLSADTLPTSLGFSMSSLECVCVMLQVFPGWNGETKPFKCMFIARLHACTSASSSYTLGLGCNHELTGVESPNCPVRHWWLRLLWHYMHTCAITRAIFGKVAQCLNSSYSLSLECKHELTSVETPSCSVWHWRLTHGHYTCLFRL